MCPLASFLFVIFLIFFSLTTAGLIHFDHIIINQPLFQYEQTATMGVIDTPTETNTTQNTVDGRISDHQPVFLLFYP